MGDRDSAPSNAANRDAALVYARRGWPVFPCDPGLKKAKRPLTRAGFRDATTDEGAIARWWAQEPRALIGLPTGRALQAFVLDFDPDGDRGVDDLRGELEEAIGAPLGDPPTADTPRGGVHLYFRVPPGESIGNRAGLIPGVDVRGDGGYVIAPPSALLQGGGWRWRRRADGAEGLIDPPAALVDLILRRRRLERPAGADRPISAGETDGPRRYGLSALERECSRVARAGPGTRNDTLNRAAFSLGQIVASGALGEAEVAAALEDAAAQSGLIADDGIATVRATVRSGLSAGAEHPREIATAQRGAPSARVHDLASERARREPSGRPAAHVVEAAAAGREVMVTADEGAA